MRQCFRCLSCAVRFGSPLIATKIHAEDEKTFNEFPTQGLTIIISSASSWPCTPVSHQKPIICRGADSAAGMTDCRGGEVTSIWKGKEQLVRQVRQQSLFQSSVVQLTSCILPGVTQALSFHSTHLLLSVDECNMYFFYFWLQKPLITIYISWCFLEGIFFDKRQLMSGQSACFHSHTYTVIYPPGFFEYRNKRLNRVGYTI